MTVVHCEWRMPYPTDFGATDGTVRQIGLHSSWLRQADAGSSTCRQQGLFFSGEWDDFWMAVPAENSWVVPRWW